MFGLFKKKAFKPTVTPEDKDWIETNISWFIEVFGLEKRREQPFILPSAETFSYENVKDPEQFRRLFEQLCSYWDLNPAEINIKFFDDLRSKQWTMLAPQGSFTNTAGLYYQSYTKGEKRFNIQLAQSNLDHPELLVAVLAHELAHVKLLGGLMINRNAPDLEPLTDLASIYFGFGIFVANSCQTADIYWIGRSGYLPNQLISYANALICYITGHNLSKYDQLLNSNTRALTRQDYQFLVHTNDTTLNKEGVGRNESAYKAGKQITEGFEKRNFNEVLEGCKTQLSINPKNFATYNDIGYALLLQKKYGEAVEAFTKAIDIEPYWDYPYNNRGYCKLQLGDLENAFADLHTSFEMNPDNSFSWRNLGAYYLRTGDLEKALQHFEEAEKIDPKTELINFYLGHTYRMMGNNDKAIYYLDKSKELNEHNDSIIE